MKIRDIELSRNNTCRRERGKLTRNTCKYLMGSFETGTELNPKRGRRRLKKARFQARHDRLLSCVACKHCLHHAPRWHAGHVVSARNLFSPAGQWEFGNYGFLISSRFETVRYSVRPEENRVIVRKMTHVFLLAKLFESMPNETVSPYW